MSETELKSGQGPARSWWSKKSLLVKALLIMVPLLIIVGLAVGLGVGLTVGKQGGGCQSCDRSARSASPGTTTTTPSSSAAGALWQPAAGTSWQIVLLNPIKTPTTSLTPNVAAIDIDMFDNSAATVSALHKLGKKVICYFSAGSYEPGRPDSKNFTAADKGKELDGWPGEYWLKLSSANVRNIMSRRIQYAANMGCDAIDPDNVDGYDNDNGLGLTQADSVDFVKFLATNASALGLATGLKNAGDIIPKVLSYVHFSVNEQCHQYEECDTYAPFITAGKPVFNIEYPKGAPSVTAAQLKTYCATSGSSGSGAKGFSTVIKKLNLDGWIEFCNGTTATTPTVTS